MASLARVKLSSILVLLLLLGQCAPVSAQEIGIEYGGMRAGYDDALERPTGLSGYIDLPLSERVAIRFSAAHYTESRTITRSPCMGLVPPGSDCASEPFDGNSSLTNYSAGLASDHHRLAPRCSRNCTLWAWPPTWTLPSRRKTATSNFSQ